MSMRALHGNAVLRFADRCALIDGERRWTFRSFEREVAALAAGLARRLKPGERVALFMPNRAEYMVLQFALEWAGLVRVPLNARYTAFEVDNILRDCGAAALFCDSHTADRVGALQSDGLWRCAVDGADWRDLLAVAEPADGMPDPDLDAICSINYTSGSSGAPKGVMLSHRNWRSVYKNMLIDREIGADEVLAHIGPLTHASGVYFTPFFLRGGTNVIVPGGQVDALLHCVERHRVTAFSCVPTVLTRIVNHPDIDRFDLSSLRWIGYGAEAIQANTLEKALARFGPMLTQNYGLTEAMMTCARLRPEEHLLPGKPNGGSPLRLGSIGRPYTFVEIVLRDPQGRPVPAGEIGEITVRAEHVMQGYWGRPEETAKVLRDGWLWSGDLARADAEGFIDLVGRSKEMLISGGFNIYPQELEACLSGCPGILEAAVIGAPDPGFGEIAIAIVAAERGAALDAESCAAFCKPQLGFRTPKRWVFVESLPRTPNGKVDKAQLRKAYATESAA
jgi:acyl-CoA synthetase (AMP-forming)/AMP-acid ligase II